MKLSEHLRLECVAPKVALEGKEAALRAVARLARKSHILSQIGEEVVFRALKEREDIGSTGFGKAIAVPHCRLAQLREFAVGIMTVPEGVEFDAVDGQKVKVLVFVVGPEHETTEHIRILSAISQVLRVEGATEKLLAQMSAESLLTAFLEYAAEQTPRLPAGERSLFHVFIRDEGIFKDVLEVFVGIGSSSVAVFDSESADTYLSGAPPSVDFWGGSAGVAKMIVATVDKPLANEIIRRIENEVGPLGHRTDMVVTVQNVYFSAGVLALER